MNNQSDTIPAAVRLNYKKGDLLIKEGDFGVAVYKIISGAVEVYCELPSCRTKLAVLGPGDLLAETAFVHQGAEPHSASARAVEDTEVEVWHAFQLAREFESVSPMIRLLVGQALRRLTHTNQVISQLNARKGGAAGETQDASPPRWEDKRRYYRKAVEQFCMYRPAKVWEKVELIGRLVDLSREGVGLETSQDNLDNFPLEVGDAVQVESSLPNGKDLVFRGKVMNKKPSKMPEHVVMGVSIIEISERCRKDLGFFLMN